MAQTPGSPEQIYQRPLLQNPHWKWQKARRLRTPASNLLTAPASPAARKTKNLLWLVRETHDYSKNCVASQ
jgi:hypothetical protein